MPKFQLPSSTNKYKDNLKDISYGNGTHKEHHQRLQNLVTYLDTIDAIREHKNSIMLGATILTQACIKQEYNNSLVGVSGGIFNNGSSLYKAIAATSIMQELEQSSDKDMVEAFALRTFYQWYKSVAYNNGERLDINPFSADSENFKSFENLLDKLASDLPPITNHMYYAIRNGNHQIASAEYSYSPSVAKDSGWNLNPFTMFYSQQKSESTAEQTKTNEASTQPTI